MRTILLLFFLLVETCILAQEVSFDPQRPKIKIDSLYREDQFYLGVTYNNLIAAPKGYSDDKIAAGFTAGFLRDMPLNKNRTVAVASGLGLTHNNYNHNFGISGSNKNPGYSFLEGGNYSKNKFSTLTLDLPIELRWRTSTFESTQFWRIYAGFKLSYLLTDRSLYQANATKLIIRNNADLNRLLYGVHLAAGYNTFNVYFQYGLNSLFKKGQIGAEKIQFQNLNIGVLFYIL
ncbi:porin family protein [Flavobacterium sp. TSSA_36]|uniref:porin family protein n=1 Tax=Flavobacterium sp. TSSA_36 TaxID=3447669 RepID=UPI003F2F932A